MSALLRATVVGLLLGGLSSLTNAAGSPFSPDAGTGVRAVQGVGALIGSAWAWSLARSPRWWSILSGLGVTVGIFPIGAALGVSLVSPSLWWPGLVAWTTALALAVVVTVRWLRLVGGRPWRAAPS